VRSPALIGAPTASEYREGDADMASPCPYGAFERLEPDEGKLSCPVLRGGGGGNAASLPDTIGVASLVGVRSGIPYIYQRGISFVNC